MLCQMFAKQYHSWPNFGDNAVVSSSCWLSLFNFEPIEEAKTLIYMLPDIILTCLA